jgi:hypothetical protein
MSSRTIFQLLQSRIQILLKGGGCHDPRHGQDMKCVGCVENHCRRVLSSEAGVCCGLLGHMWPLSILRPMYWVHKYSSV